MSRAVDALREPLRAGGLAAVAVGVLVALLVDGAGGIALAVLLGAVAGVGAWAAARELPPPPPPEGWNRHDTLKPPPEPE